MGQLDKAFRKTFDHADYDAVREDGRPWLSLERRGIISVSGSEAVQFLNGMITNDVARLQEDAAMLAAFPNPKGRLIAIARVSLEQGSFIFETEESTYKTVLSNLQRFTLAGDFQVDDLTESFDVVSVRGTVSAASIKSLFGAAPDPASEVTRLAFDGNEVVCIPAARVTGFDLRIPTGITGSVIEALKDNGVVQPAAPLDEVFRIESGIPRFGIDMDGETVIPEIGLEGLISYEKGCYIGQEVIARIHFRGKVAKELKGLVFEAPEALVNKGDELLTHEGKNAGVVTSKTYSPKLKRHIAMAYVRSAYAANGTELRIGHQKCRVADLPFIH